MNPEVDIGSEIVIGHFRFLHNAFGHVSAEFTLCKWAGSIMINKYCLPMDGFGLIPTATTTITASGDAEHVSLIHRLASPY